MCSGFIDKAYVCLPVTIRVKYKQSVAIVGGIEGVGYLRSNERYIICEHMTFIQCLVIFKIKEITLCRSSFLPPWIMG